jgi:16S rRNA processing protein RimM
MSYNNILIMDNSKFITIAKITSMHGIKGEMKIFLYGNKNDFLAYKEYYIDNKKVNLSIKNKNSPQLIIKITDIIDRNQAEELRNKLITIKKSELKDLKEHGDFYIDELVNLSVIDQKSQIIGKVLEISNHGAGDNITILFTDEKTRQYPFIKNIFSKVNLEKMQITFIEPEII